MNHCGTCNACCRVFAIPEVKKAAGPWCQHCDIGKGCKIYEDRPQVCVEFKCLWLLSREREPRDHLADNLRPDRCKVVFNMTTDDTIMAATTMPGAEDAWRKPHVRDLIDKLVRGMDYSVACGPPQSRRKTMIDKYGEHEVEMSAPDENGIQWGTRKKA